MKKVIILSLALVFITTGCSLNLKTNKKINPDEAKEITTNFINNNLLKPGDKVVVGEVKEEDGLYKMQVILPGGQEITSYITKDGKKFFPEAMIIEEVEKQNQQAQANDSEVAAANVPKKEKPEVELFVMSHCPYGTQIEKGMLPVVKALGDKINFTVKFVDYAMHGEKEIDEQLRQVCIQENNETVFNNYLNCFLENGESEQCLKTANVDVKKMNTCVANYDKQYKIKETFNDKNKWTTSYPPFDVYKADNQKYGVQGSPTLVINGAKVSSGRDSASLLKTICAGFENQPEECSAQLPNITPAPGFGFSGSGTDAQAECG